MAWRCCTAGRLGSLTLMLSANTVRETAPAWPKQRLKWKRAERVVKMTGKSFKLEFWIVSRTWFKNVHLLWSSTGSTGSKKGIVTYSVLCSSLFFIVTQNCFTFANLQRFKWLNLYVKLIFSTRSGSFFPFRFICTWMHMYMDMTDCFCLFTCF